MVIGFDLDGVILTFPGYNFIKKTRAGYILLRYLVKIRIFRETFYRLAVRPNRNIKKVLLSLKNRGDKIVIISGNPGPNEFIEKYLKRKDIPFDDLLLWKNNEPKMFFKLNKIFEGGCNIYIDDEPLIVIFLERQLSSSWDFQAIYFHNQSLVELKKIFHLS